MVSVVSLPDGTLSPVVDWATKYGRCSSSATASARSARSSGTNTLSLGDQVRGAGSVICEVVTRRLPSEHGIRSRLRLAVLRRRTVPAAGERLLRVRPLGGRACIPALCRLLRPGRARPRAGG